MSGEVVTRLADLTYRRPRAVWLLVPHSDAGGALDGVPLRLGHAGQYLRLEDDWLTCPAVVPR